MDLLSAGKFSGIDPNLYTYQKNNTIQILIFVGNFSSSNHRTKFFMFKKTFFSFFQKRPLDNNSYIRYTIQHSIKHGLRRTEFDLFTE